MTSEVARHPGVAIEEFKRDPTLISGACFRGPFESYRRALASSTEASDNYHLAVYATVAGCVVGRRAYLPHGRFLFANKYTILAGDTGDSRKSTSIFYGRRLLGDVGVDVDTLTTSSWEGLLEALAREGGGRVLLLPGEFRSLAAKAKQESTSNLIPGLTEAFDCPPDLKHRTRGKDLRAERPFLAILTSSTGEWLQSSIAEGDIAGGFLNRWTFVDGHPKEPNPFPAEPDPALWAEAVGALVDLDARLRQYPETTGLRLVLSSEARDRWADFYTRSRSWKYPNETLAALGQRLQDTALKMALLYALLEGYEEIRTEHLGAGISFAEWQRSAHRRVFEGFGASQQNRLEERIRKYLASSRDSQMTFSTLRQMLGGKYASQDVLRALDAMVRAGEARTRTTPRGMAVALTSRLDQAYAEDAR